jgi:hypothetical protein
MSTKMVELLLVAPLEDAKTGSVFKKKVDHSQVP